MVLDHVARNQRAGATEASLAVHGHGTIARLDDAKELVDDADRRRAAIGKDQVVVCDTLRDEALALVQWRIQADHGFDVVVVKGRRKLLC